MPASPRGFATMLDWVESHAYLARSVIDWVALVVLLIASRLMGLGSQGFRQLFSLDDPALQHPYAEHERVPDALLFILAMGVPLVSVLLLSGAHTRPWSRMNSAALGLLLALALTGTVTNLVKTWVGRPRPDLLDRCKPDLDALTSGGSAAHDRSGLVSERVCTVPHDTSLLEDGFRSFPSGHAGTAFAGLVYLALSVRAALKSMVGRVVNSYAYTQPPSDMDTSEELTTRTPPPHEPWMPITFSVLVPLVPVLAAAYIAASRVMDYRHHPTDVLAGATLGSLMALVVYRATHRA